MNTVSHIGMLILLKAAILSINWENNPFINLFHKMISILQRKQYIFFFQFRINSNYVKLLMPKMKQNKTIHTIINIKIKDGEMHFSFKNQRRSAQINKIYKLHWKFTDFHTKLQIFHSFLATIIITMEGRVKN